MKISKVRQWGRVMNSKKARRPAVAFVILSMVVLVVVMIGEEVPEFGGINENRERKLRSLLTSYSSVRNSNRVKSWRESATRMCENASNEEEIEAAREMALQAFSYKRDEEIDVMDRDLSSVPVDEATVDGNYDKNNGYDYDDGDGDDEGHDKVIRCPFVLLDLGSGVGDSVGEFIDAGSVACPTNKNSNVNNNGSNSNGNNNNNKKNNSNNNNNKKNNSNSNSNNDNYNWEEPHFDVDSGLVSFGSEEHRSRVGESDEEFVQWTRDRLARFSESIGPEDYCVYGVEGSPVLKPDLLKLQRHIRKMDPRPLRHLHFFTETIALDSFQKRKTLYLDTTNAQDRFPGSSVFATHQSILSSEQRDSELMDYSATTISLSQLMTDTLSFYAPIPPDTGTGTGTDTQQQQKQSQISNNGPPDLALMEKNSRNHLLLNIDVEGSEYHVLNEVKDSGLLCDFAKAGNQVDIFIQYHDPQTVGVESANAKRWVKEVRPYFRRNCGDNISFYERQRYFMPPSPPKILTNAVV